MTESVGIAAALFYIRSRMAQEISTKQIPLVGHPARDASETLAPRLGLVDSLLEISLEH